MNNKKINIFAIQYLRGIAALMVVFFHASREVRNLLGGSTFAWGEFGVDIFFIISGFVMVVSSIRSEDDRSAFSFFANRLIRITPMYWLMTLVMVIMMLVRPGPSGPVELNAERIITSLLFIPNFNNDVDGTVMPVLFLGWTLQYEMFFYLLFGLFIWLPMLSRIISVSFILMTCVAFFSTASCDNSAICIFLGNSIILEFSLGMTIGLLYHRNWIMPRTLAPFVALVSFSLILMASSVHARISTAGILSAIFVYASISSSYKLKAGLHNFLKLLGDSSYSLYLTHIFVIGVVKLLWRFNSPAAMDSNVFTSFLYIALCIFCSILTGILVYNMIEKPITNTFRKIILPRPLNN